jgi:hypothetical protein
VSVPGGGHLIYNNIIYNCGSAAYPNHFKGIRVGGGEANSTSTALIANNTIYHFFNTQNYAIADSIGVATIRNNIAYQAGLGIAGGTQSNNLLTDPSFVSAATANFKLQSSSAAIDAGVTVLGVAVDYTGKPRPAGPAYDIGAYESGVLTNSPSAPRNLTVR